MSYLSGPGQPAPQPAPQPYDDSWPSYGPVPMPDNPPHGPYGPVSAPAYGPVSAPAYGPVYGPVPGPYGQPGWDPAYGPAPARSSPAAAFASAVLFLACAIQSFVFALSAWFGDSDNPHLAAGLVGVVFSGEVTGNLDFAISATMTVACSTTTFALAFFARLTAIRWILVVLGGLVTVYYFFALLYIAANGGARYIAMPAVAMLLWAVATGVALLPATSHAMRRLGNT